MTEALTKQEQGTLAEYEETIRQGMSTFVDIGRALTAIRDNRLYRANYGTFEEYCSKKWDMSRPRAYQLIGSVEVGEQNPEIAVESHARQLKSVAPERRKEVVSRALQLGGGKLSASSISKAAEQVVKQEEPAAEKTRLDEAGRPVVDPEVAQALDHAEEIVAVAVKLRAIKREIKAIADMPWGDRINADSVETKIDDVLTILKFAVPYTTKPDCGHHGHKIRTPWLTKEEWDNLPGAYKK